MNSTVDTPPPGPKRDLESLPTLYRDRSFWGMTITQFLGALNDTIFKQIMGLLTAAVVLRPGSAPSDWQWLATQSYAIPFVLFSGTAGFLADRISKRWIVVSAKVAEISVMLWGMVAFAAIAGHVHADNSLVTEGVPWMLLAVLFLMGTHSAYFGPAKYGILPEIARPRDLPRFNGIIQMTTFLALIFGVPLAGVLVHRLGPARLWMAGAICAGIAVLGTVTSLFVRRTPPAQPEARFSVDAVAVGQDTWTVLRSDRALRMALLVYSIFWFAAAMVPMATNSLGLYQLGLNAEDTSFMLAPVGLGIAVGCILAAWLSRNKVSFRLVRIGAWGLVVCLLLMAPPGLHGPHLLGYRGSQLVLGIAGIFTGLLAIPLQVFLQARPPEHLKGRVIGTMNLINWIGIVVSGGFYWLCDQLMLTLGAPKSGTFALTAVLLLPVALFYHPPDAPL